MTISDDLLQRRLAEVVAYLDNQGGHDAPLSPLPPDDPFAPLYAAVARAATAAGSSGADALVHASERKWLAAEEKFSELYLDFVRVQEDAAARLREVESLLEGLRVLTESFDSGENLAGLLHILRGILEFEHAVVLTGPEGQALRAIAASHPLLGASLWQPQSYFERVLSGKALAAFDVAQVPEWQVQSPDLRALAVSALHLSLRSGDEQAMLICTHGERGYFTRKHIALAQRFALLATQALHNTELYLALKHERDTLDLRVRERTQDLAQARDEALEASRLKSELLANVNHELRTPLNAIMGYAEMLREGVHGEISLEQQGVMERILANAGDLLLYINDLLDEAQMEAGMVKLHPLPFSPAQLVATLLVNLEGLARAKGLRLQSHIEPGVPPSVYGDGRRLQQLLTNLLGNAIKFTEAGEVRLLLSRPSPSHWALTVSDTGLGIPAEARDRIFDPFRQVDGSITRRFGGFGLGLSIVKQLVTLMGGQITVQSEVGQGSTFTILLPLALTEEPIP